MAFCASSPWKPPQESTVVPLSRLQCWTFLLTQTLTESELSDFSLSLCLFHSFFFFLVTPSIRRICGNSSLLPRGTMLGFLVAAYKILVGFFLTFDPELQHPFTLLLVLMFPILLPLSLSFLTERGWALWRWRKFVPVGTIPSKQTPFLFLSDKCELTTGSHEKTQRTPAGDRTWVFRLPVGSSNHRATEPRLELSANFCLSTNCQFLFPTKWPACSSLQTRND